MAKARQIQTAGREAGEEALPLEAASKLVEHLPVPVFFKGRDGRYLGVNRAWEQFFGIARSAFLGKQVADLYPQDPEVAARHAAMDRELFERPGSQSYEIPIRTRDGERRDTLYYKATFTDARGEVAGLLGAIVDITARKSAEAALRENEERWRAIVNSANDGILVYDRDLKIIAGNQAAERIIGLPMSEIVGAPGFTSLLSCVHEDGSPVRPEDRATKQTVKAGRPLTGHLVGINRPGGAITWLSVNTAFLRQPGSSDWYGMVSTITDVTARRYAEDALRESEARFRQTFELAASGIAHVDLQGRFVRVNRRLCAILGYAENELIGRSVKDISHPEDRDITDAQRERVRAGESEVVRFEKRYLRKDRSVVWVNLSVALVRGGHGEPAYEIAVFDDITERKLAQAHLHESEERYRRTFELAGSGVAHIGLDRNFIRVNKRLCEIMGYEAHELIGHAGREFSHPDDLDVINSQRPALYSGELEAIHIEKRYLRKDGSTVWVAYSMTVERDAEGKPLYEIAIFDDVTARKDAEAALHAAHEELKRSNAELEQFAYVASHDLQEPLRMVGSYTQLVMRRYGDKLDAQAKEFMGYVVDGATRMKQLIEDLLAYSRVGTRGKEMAPVALEAPLRKALANLRASVEESSAAVTWDPLPTAWADELQMAQLFQNLIGNALKFRGPSVPRIHVFSAEEPHQYQIVVADNGIGIEPQYYERIFMVFQRLHAMGEYPGTGIGLAICRKVVERHGGRIWVESRPGEGSRFMFTLPKREAP